MSARAGSGVGERPVHGQRHRHRVLLVEDDPQLREEILLPTIAGAGYACTAVGSALEMYRNLAARPYDLILIDMGLPDEDGFVSIQHLRQLTRAAVVVLSGMDSDADRIRGLGNGADAYLCKPIEADVLLAWVESVLRRAGGAGGANAGPAALSWRLVDGGWRLLTPDGASVTLSAAERVLMGAFLGARGAKVRRDDLVAALEGEVPGFAAPRLEMLVHRLRRKVQRATGTALPLLAIRGIGYAFNP
ncbi:response regulator transcription factor [Luteimonas sp. RD2P54]|uniref:Response regulator transcription factor n=1 Tax=Luteimonas endophytica TaxID=3042023 RepID=A0ABT6J6E5_9GAMM|nr:response regulator transcription factor [Luteimonas endophytica]MDH5822407.1 response regulator transcription factor [Luteimonas endophytica]